MSESVEETQSSTEESDQEHEEQSSEPYAFIRSKKRAKTKELYLKDKSRKPYRKGKELSTCTSFEDTNLPQSSSSGPSDPTVSAHFESSEWNDKVCKSCAPVLIKYSETFRGMKRQGSELKRRKLINPHPKQPDKEQYRDLVKQNDWLRNNVFDSLGNYIFLFSLCTPCSRSLISKTVQAEIYKASGKY